MDRIETSPIAVDLDTKVHAHMALATFNSIPGVDTFHLAAVVAFLADLPAADRRAVLKCAERTAERAAAARAARTTDED
jgi:hypothetical protein